MGELLLEDSKEVLVEFGRHRDAQQRLWQSSMAMARAAEAPGWLPTVVVALEGCSAVWR